MVIAVVLSYSNATTIKYNIWGYNTHTMVAINDVVLIEQIRLLHTYYNHN